MSRDHNTKCILDDNEMMNIRKELRDRISEELGNILISQPQFVLRAVSKKIESELFKLASSRQPGSVEGYLFCDKDTLRGRIRRVCKLIRSRTIRQRQCKRGKQKQCKELFSCQI